MVIICFILLKMRAYIFTPGDLICRRGEVAREMFIIADGVVEILGYVWSIFFLSSSYKIKFYNV